MDPDGRIAGAASKLVKLVFKGGDVAATFAGAVDDTRTLFASDSTWVERVAAGASLATEIVSPVSARDAKAIAGAVGETARVGNLPKPPTGPGSVPKDERDPKRLFTPSERAAKREGQGGMCGTGCGTQIDASNSAGHHIERHADGGLTVPSNHAEVCIDCHDKLHSRGGP